MHQNQNSEWAAFNLASTIDAGAAKKSISMGLVQIMGFNNRAIGYASPDAMFAAFAADEKFQLLGFFNFVKNDQRQINALRNRDFAGFARIYNGPGQPDFYGGLIKGVVDGFGDAGVTVRDHMPKTTQPSYTLLAHQVTDGASEPLPFDELMRRVQQIRPIDTKNPKGTLRNAIGQSRLIVNTGDGRYGWMLRLINESIMRLTLTANDFNGTTIELGDDTREFLWPTFFEIQSRCDRSPIALQLPAGTLCAMGLVHLHDSQWGMTGPPEFWQWFKTLQAAPGDHLLLRPSMASISFTP